MPVSRRAASAFVVVLARARMPMAMRSALSRRTMMAALFRSALMAAWTFVPLMMSMAMFVAMVTIWWSLFHVCMVEAKAVEHVGIVVMRGFVPRATLFTPLLAFQGTQRFLSLCALLRARSLKSLDLALSCIDGRHWILRSSSGSVSSMAALILLAKSIPSRGLRGLRGIV